MRILKYIYIYIYIHIYIYIYIHTYKWDKNRHSLNKQQLFLYAFVKVVVNNLKPRCVYAYIVTTIIAWFIIAKLNLVGFLVLL